MTCHDYAMNNELSGLFPGKILLNWPLHSLSHYPGFCLLSLIEKFVSNKVPQEAIII